MTDKQKFKSIKELSGEWQEKLHLTNWQFNIIFKDKDENNSILSINPCPVYCKAAITVYPVFWKQTQDMKEQCMAHELLHCVLEPLCKLSFDFLNGNLHTAATINDTTENVVQRLATIISPLKSSVYTEGKNDV